MLERETALAKPIALKPTVVSRLVLGMVAAGPIALAISSGAFLAVGAISAIVIAAGYGLAARSVTVDDNGITTRSLFGTRSLTWDEITHYTYWSGPPRATFVGVGIERSIDGPYAGVSRCRHTLTLFGPRGKRIAITTAFAKAGRAIAFALEQLHQRRAGATSFAPFSIEDDGLRHAKTGLVRWVDVEEVRLRSYPPVLEVMKINKSWPWATVPLTKLHDGNLFLERIAERGIPIDIGNKQLITEKLVATLGRNAALPRAEVVVRRAKPSRRG